MAGINGAFSSDTQRAIMPAMSPEYYKTYGMAYPLKTHWRPATCEEVQCEAYRGGWVSTFDLSTELGRKQYAFCKADRERRFTMQKAGTSLVKLVYGPGQPCFRRGDHKVPLERPARYYVSGGDWRGNPRRTPALVHASAQDWAEDFAIHQDRLKTAIERG